VNTQPTEPGDDDVFSPRTVRLVCGVTAVAMFTLAWFITTAWADWVTVAVGVFFACAAVIPSRRRPAP
jgi:hypothetical protein